MSMRSSVRVCSAVLYKAQGKNVAIEIELSSLILGPLVFDAAFSNAFFKISEKKPTNISWCLHRHLLGTPPLFVLSRPKINVLIAEECPYKINKAYICT